MISRKNITLVYKRSTIISFNKNKNTKTIIRLRLGDFPQIIPNIIPQIQNVQSQNCISITCCSDSTGYFVKQMRYLLYLTFKVRYSKYLMLAWQLHATTRETPHENILNMAATIFHHVFLRF